MEESRNSLSQSAVGRCTCWANEEAAQVEVGTRQDGPARAGHCLTTSLEGQGQKAPSPSPAQVAVGRPGGTGDRYTQALPAAPTGFLPQPRGSHRGTDMRTPNHFTNPEGSITSAQGLLRETRAQGTTHLACTRQLTGWPAPASQRSACWHFILTASGA